MQRVEFVFSYKPQDGQHEIDAYDAVQALTGIARSLSLATHYVLNGEVIKHATALKRGSVRILPPQAGSFEFIAPVIQFATENPGLAAGTGAVALNVFSNYVTDLTKYLYRMVSGLSEKPETDALKKALKEKPGDINTLADFVNDDVVKIHRPVSHQINHFTINGGNNSFGTFNARTRDYAQSQV